MELNSGAQMGLVQKLYGACTVDCTVQKQKFLAFMCQASNFQPHD